VRRERSGVGRRLTPIIALLAGLASVLGLVAAAPIAVAQPTARSGIEALARTDGGSHGAKPTVVLAHGSWADGSSWNGVIERLQRAGYPFAPSTSRCAASRTTPGSWPASCPRSLARSCWPPTRNGGAVISNGDAASPNVKALVYVDAFVPDVGESILQLAGPDSVLAGDPAMVFDIVPFGPGDLDLYLKKNVYQEEVASDLPRRTSAVLYATQRPAAAGGFAETATAAAWRTIPSWYLVGAHDNVIPADRQRFMAQRARARTVEIVASHVSLSPAPPPSPP
jgi:hypothetical protein